MTMQTTTLPFQVSGASALAQPQRNPAAGVQAPEAGQFSATLSRAMAPTMAPTPAPAAAPASKPAAPARQADKPAAQGPKPATREPAKQNEASSDAPATAQGAASAESGDPAKDAAAAAESASAAADAATTPATDMLAFMAALTQAPAAAPVAAEAATAAGGAELQLAALQSAFAKLETADGGVAAADPLAAADSDAAGFSLAAGVQTTAQESADLRAQAQASVPLDAGKAQPQLRDAAANTAANLEAPLPTVTQLQAQAAKLEGLPNPAAMPGDRIPARLGTQAWDNQVSQRIVYMVGKEQAATLTLNPPDLGPVQVVLNVTNDGASVAFSSNQQEVRQALENALPRLREMMGESGIALGNATVDAGMPDGRQAQQDGERRHGNGGGPGNAGGTVAVGDDAAARPATRTVSLGDNGLVDTFA
ncbi:flagellar hook-length control protein FliK [Massilia sp. LC238]|uniref:flagellar hook-length control protein FliK n=1 Tax=Massilia sp. LC238 TaxID=1502852 RepID=UPI0004E36CE7|nr:flagellar hook-length control protein FliK [Massilia sp. LC238]KFC69091.1 Flagellar hook-length control protein FliK [Massilia sp. LC238]